VTRLPAKTLGAAAGGGLMEIRRAESDGDFTAYVEVWNAITPSEPITVAETKRRLARQPWRLYLVVEEDGRIVGSGFAGRSDSAERAFLAVRVLIEWRRRGIGTALFEACRPHAVELGAATISGRMAEHDADSLRWAANRGFGGRPRRDLRRRGRVLAGHGNAGADAGAALRRLGPGRAPRSSRLRRLRRRAPGRLRGAGSHVPRGRMCSSTGSPRSSAATAAEGLRPH